MAELKPQVTDFSKINGGNRYENGDGVGAEAINGAIEASWFASALANNDPVYKETEDGIPAVLIEYSIGTGTPFFAFYNMKGEDGKDGIGAIKEFKPSDFVNGYFTFGTGITASDYQLCTPTPIRVHIGDEIITKPNGLKLQWWIRNGDNVVNTTQLKVSGLQTEDFEYISEHDGYLFAAIAPNGSILRPNDYVSEIKVVDNRFNLLEARVDELERRPDTTELEIDIATSFNGTRQVEFEQGTIYSSDGKLGDGDTRIRTKDYIPVNPYCITAKSNYSFKLFLYGEDKNFIATLDWLTSADLNGIFAQYPSVKYFKLVLNRANGVIEPSEGVNCVFYTKSFKELLDKHPNYDYEYNGERISTKRKLRYEKFMNAVINQAMCIYNDIALAFSSNGTFRVYDLLNKTEIGNYQLGGTNIAVPHCNSASLSRQFYAETDEFPLIYINAYNNAGLPKGTCYVHRLIGDRQNGYTTELVQTISVGFVDNDIWTNGQDIRPYGNFCVDYDHNCLIAYTLRDSDNKTRFFKFNLPDIAYGNITLNEADIIEMWDCDYYEFIQDSTYHAGKIYICHGSGASGTSKTAYIRVVDLDREKEVSSINLISIGLSNEPEGIDLYNDDLMYGAGNLYKFEFN